MANRNPGQNEGASPRSGTSNRGFASMGAAQQREIARMGGEAVSGNREHMAQIGRKGGEASAESRASARSARARTTTGDSDRGLGSRPRTDANPSPHTLHARARGADDGNRVIGARSAGDETADLGLGGRARDDETGDRNLSSRARGDDQGSRGNVIVRGREDNASRSVGGRDADDNHGGRGSPMGAPRSSRDDDN